MQLPTHSEFNRLPAKQRRSIAAAVASELPEGFELRGVQRCSLRKIKNYVAMFSGPGDSLFALLLGGEIELGFDVSGWKPKAEERASWQASVEEWGLKDSIFEMVDKCTLSPRRTTLGPLLIETAAAEAGWRSVGPDDPGVKRLLEGEKLPKRRPFSCTICSKDLAARVKRDAGGPITFEVGEPVTHASLKKALKKLGFRYPTSDEWEYACGGGGSTLFRWGDHAPCDRYPTDVSPAEAAWRIEWVLSGGKLKYPAAGFQSDWNFHRQPNAFGLLIAENPYNFELVHETNTTRGGDGGSMVCGGAGYFAAWTTLATAYFERDVCRFPRGKPIDIVNLGHLFGRRVLPLGDSA